MDKETQRKMNELMDKSIKKLNELCSYLDNYGGLVNPKSVINLIVEIDSIDAKLFELPLGFWKRRQLKSWHEINQKHLKFFLDLIKQTK